MTVARSVADVLDDHVVFEVESIDRMYLNVWQPRLAYGGGVQGFFVGHRGYHYASTALMDPMTKAFVADIHGFVAARGLELVQLRQGPAQGRPRPGVPGQVHRRGGGAVRRPGPGEGRGVAHPAPLQPVDRGQLRLAGPLHGVHQLLLLLLRGRRLRPVLPQVQHLLPLHRQVVHQRQRVGQAPGREGRDRVRRRWTTGSPRATTCPRCRRSATASARTHIDALLRKWLAILPNPFAPEDETAGYRYELSVLQAEFSLTQMLDRPVSGRIFFEQVLHDNLDIGRPDQVSLIFDRRIIRKGRARPRAGSAPGSSPTGSSRRCTSTTRTPRSSSTTNKGGRYAPRPRSTTPATSGCRNG